MCIHIYLINLDARNTKDACDLNANSTTGLLKNVTFTLGQTNLFLPNCYCNSCD